MSYHLHIDLYIIENGHYCAYAVLFPNTISQPETDLLMQKSAHFCHCGKELIYSANGKTHDKNSPAYSAINVLVNSPSFEARLRYFKRQCNLLFYVGQLIQWRHFKTMSTRPLPWKSWQYDICIVLRFVLYDDMTGTTTTSTNYREYWHFHFSSFNLRVACDLSKCIL